MKRRRSSRSARSSSRSRSCVVAHRQAQLVVYDPANYFEAVAQVRADDPAVPVPDSSRRKRVPVDMETPLSRVLAGLDVARPRRVCCTPSGCSTRSIRAMRQGAAYRGDRRPARRPDRRRRAGCPPDMQRRLADGYATIELAGQHATGWPSIRPAARVPKGRSCCRRSGTSSTTPSIPATTSIRRRRCWRRSTPRRRSSCGSSEQTNQFLLSALEQLIVDNKRKRDAEAAADERHDLSVAVRPGLRRRPVPATPRPNSTAGARTDGEGDDHASNLGYDPIGTVQQAITSLLSTQEPQFIGIGNRMFLSFATILLAWHGIRMMLGVARVRASRCSASPSCCWSSRSATR